MKKILLAVAACLVAGAVTQDWVAAQSSMIGTMPTRRQEEGVQMTLGDMSFTAQPVQAPKTIREHDLVTVIVKKNWRSLNEGELERKRKMSSDYGITKWISFNGLNFSASKFDEGNPALGAKIDSRFKNEGSVIRRESLEFKITCSIDSIQENGILLLEGIDSTTLAEEGKIIYFSGYARPQDIQPDNTILSERLYLPEIKEVPSGSVYDSYRRNWGQKIIDRYSPF